MKASYYNCDKTFTLGACKPISPNPGEVRIRVSYCGLCGTDLHVYHGNMDARVGCERIIGHEMSGTVDAVGLDISDISVGDKVVVRPLEHCGDCAACKKWKQPHLSQSEVSRTGYRWRFAAKLDSTQAYCSRSA